MRLAPLLSLPQVKTAAYMPMEGSPSNGKVWPTWLRIPDVSVANDDSCFVHTAHFVYLAWSSRTSTPITYMGRALWLCLSPQLLLLNRRNRT